MNRSLRFILLAEGTSDQALEPIIKWLLREKLSLSITYDLQFFRRREELSAEIAEAAKVGDVIFVHRDADAQGRDIRFNEIKNAVGAFKTWVALIPVRMTEAWLLFDESAIRQAASNPKGRVDLKLPPKKTWETIADPKAVLIEALKLATEYSGRKLHAFNTSQARHRVAQQITNYSPLRQLEGFQEFEAHLDQVLKNFR
jgi:hypothetical protein